MKENNQNSKKQRKLFLALEPKKSFFQRITGEKTSFSQMLKSFPSIFFLPMCIVCCYLLSILFIGDGAYGYSEELYTIIEQTIENYLVTKDNFQIDISEASNTSDTIIETENDETSSSFSEEGIYFGIDSLKIYEQYQQYGQIGKVNINLEPNNSKIVSTIKLGFFEAQVTNRLLDNFSTIGEPERNFDSLGQYMIYFWLIFGACFIVGGIVLWFVAELVIYYVFLRFIIWVASKKITTSEQTSDNSQALVTQESSEQTVVQS